MELSPSQIAKLVLGYLKMEKCPGAYYDFLHNCQHFKSPVKRKRKKYIVTRVNGMSLSEILHDYARMYTIIQGRLEDTEYFDGRHNSNRIVPQLLYLLDNVLTSGSTTPYTHYGSRSPTPERGSLTNFANDVHQPPELSATSLKSLPGHNENNKENDSFDEAANNGSHHLEAAVQTFAQTLLEHPELQEKIADNINRFRHPEKERCGSDDIDAAIKAVLDRTESDPVFESFMGEIIGTVSETTSTSSVEKDKSNAPQSTSTPCNKPQETKHPDQNNVQSTIEAQNKSAIESIISACQNVEQANKTPTEVIFCEATGQFVQSPIVLNTTRNNQSAMTTTTSHYSASTIESMKPYLVFNTQPPQQLTEQDIINMPTVILMDDRNEKAILLDGQQQTYIKPQQPPVKMKKEAETNTDLITIYSMDDKSGGSIKSPLKHCKTVKSLKKKQVSINRTVVVNTIESESSGGVPTIEILDSEVTPTDDGKDQKRSSTPRSGGRSHVRALDFNFRTPIKDVPPNEPKEKKATDNAQPPPKSAKSLFKTENHKSGFVKPPTTTKSLSSWDADLRAAIPPTSLPAPPPKKKPCPPKPKKPASAKKPKKKKDEAKVEAEQKPSSVVHLQLSENEHIKIRKFNAKAVYPRKCNIEGSVVLQPNAVRRAAVKVEVKPEDAVKVEPAKFEVRSEPAMVEVRAEPAKVDVGPEPAKCEARPEPVEVTEPAKPDPEPVDTKFVAPSAQCAPPSTSKRIPVLETPVKHPPDCPKTPGYYSPVDVSFSTIIKENLKDVDLTSIATPKFPLTPNFPFTPFLEGQSSHSNRATDYSTSSSYYQPSDTEQSKSLEKIIIEECKRLEERKKVPTVEDEATVDVNDVKVEVGEVKVELGPAVAKMEPTDGPEKAIAEKMKSLRSNVIGRKNLSLMREKSAPASDDGSSDSDSGSSSSSESWTEPLNKTTASRDNSLSHYSLRSKTKDSSAELAENEKKIDRILQSTEYKPNLFEKSRDDEKVEQQKKVLMELEEKRKRTIAKFKSEAEAAPETVEKKAPSVPPKKRNLRSNSTKAPATAKRPRVASIDVSPATDKPNTKTPKKKGRSSTSKSKATKDAKKEAAAPKQDVLEKAKEGEKAKDVEKAKAEEKAKEVEKTKEEEKMKEEEKAKVLKNIKEEEKAKKVENTKEEEKAKVLKNMKEEEKAKKVENTKEEEKMTPDQEAEELVKGLKERGIHLMHKSQEKLATEPKKEAPNTKPKPPPKRRESKAKDKADDNGTGNKQSAKAKAPEKSKAPTKKSDRTKPAKPKTNKTKAASKAPVAKPDTVTNPPQVTPETVRPEIARTETAPPPITNPEPDDDTGFTVRNYADVIRAYHNGDAVGRTYDTEFINKKLTLRSYDESGNLIKRILSCTPFETLLDIHSRPVKVLSDIKMRTKSRPLKMLYNQLIPTTTANVATASPLDDLYAASPNPTGGRYRNQKSIKADEAKRSDEAVIDAKEDELMNYAIIGCDRKIDDSPIFDKRKRNSESLEDDSNDKKKIKTEKELLTEVNVEAFLKQLHGE